MYNKKCKLLVETTVIENVPTKVVKGQIRSGQQIYAKNTDLIIMGSVGNGAEVIADGNIHVYGTIRGTSYRWSEWAK